MNKELLEIIAIDESGITSFRGFSVYAFVFIPAQDYRFISQYILNVEQELGLNYIHRHEMSWKVRLDLVKRLTLVNFFIRVVVYENPINQSKKLEESLIHISEHISHAYRIFIDGKKGKIYRKYFNSLIKPYSHKKLKIKFVATTSEPILRLADFIAGSIRSYLDNTSHKQSNEIYKIFKNKIIELHNIK